MIKGFWLILSMNYLKMKPTVEEFHSWVPSETALCSYQAIPKDTYNDRLPIKEVADLSFSYQNPWPWLKTPPLHRKWPDSSSPFVTSYLGTLGA